MDDCIGYEALTQAAMRGVVREALKQVAANTAPPGDHHFYITFRSRAPGVKIADQLVERFPEEMTIVVQHQFWDLEVHEGHFEIILKFNGVPQHLSIPFAAMTRFVDPSVNFGVSFERHVPDEAIDLISPTGDRGSDVPSASGDEADDATVVSLDHFRRK